MRFVICFLAALAFLLAYNCRFNLSTVIIYMCEEQPAKSDPGPKLILDDADDFHKANDSSTMDNDSMKHKSDKNPSISYDLHAFGKSEEHSLAMINNWNYDHNRNFVETSNSSSSINSTISDRSLGRSQTSEDQLSKYSLSSFSDFFKSSKVKWTDEEKMTIHSGFFYGYILTNIPGAVMAEKFGAKPVLLFAGLGSGICSLLFPFVAKISFNFAFLTRVLLGIIQGPLFPSVYILYSQWLPDSERPKLLAIPSALSRFGIILMNPLIPPVVENFGWESVFYFWGCVMILWCLAWIVLGTSNPASNVFLSSEEKNYIASGMMSKNESSNDEITQSKLTKNVLSISQPENNISSPPVNWMKLLFRTKSIWTLTTSMIAAEWCNYLLLVKLSGFLKDVYLVDKTKITWINSCLLTIFSIGYPLAGYTATKLVECNCPKIVVRKGYELAACFIQASCCLALPFCTTKTSVVIAFLTMMFGRSLVGGGQCLIPPEISKVHSGTIFAVASTISSLGPALGPSIDLALLGNQSKKLAKSYTAFWILSASYFIFAGITFCLLGDISDHDFEKKNKEEKDKVVQMNKFTFIVDR